MAEISIIIPVYNGSGRMFHCMVSLMGQTIGREMLEIIIVNDGSTDDTLEKLMEWERQYPETIMLINLEQNAGAGAARNVGLSYASGEYIGFVDSDDYIEDTMYESMYQKMKEQDCDLVICRSRKHLPEEGQQAAMGRGAEKDRLVQVADDKDREAFLRLEVSASPCNKLYRRSMLEKHQIRFPEGFIYEDVYFIELVKNYANRIYFLEEYLYHYVTYKNSVSNSSGDGRKRMHRFIIEQLMLEELKGRGIYEKYQSYYDQEFIITYLTVVKNFIRTFGFIPADLLTEINGQVRDRYPQYNDIPIVRQLTEAKSENFYNYLLNGLEQEVDSAYIEKLARLAV